MRAYLTIVKIITKKYKTHSSQEKKLQSHKPTFNTTKKQAPWESQAQAQSPLLRALWKANRDRSNLIFRGILFQRAEMPGHNRPFSKLL